MHAVIATIAWHARENETSVHEIYCLAVATASAVCGHTNNTLSVCIIVSGIICSTLDLKQREFSSFLCDAVLSSSNTHTHIYTSSFYVLICGRFKRPS